MFFGNVKWYNMQKGYGFIIPDDASKDIFVHATQLEKIGLRSVATGQRIAYEPYNDCGRIAAGNLKLLYFLKLFGLINKPLLRLVCLYEAFAKRGYSPVVCSNLLQMSYSIA